MRVVAYLKSEQRKSRAQEVAFQLLQEGVQVEELTLRRVAEAMGSATSTLTYVYPSIGMLLDDLTHEHALIMGQTMRSLVGHDGLREELQRIVRRYYLYALGDDAHTGLIRYSIRASVSEHPPPGRVTPEGDAQLIQEIRDRAGEHYRVPDQLIANLLSSIIYGLTLGWAVTGHDETCWQAATASIEALTLLADPRPIGTPNIPYELPPLPDREAEWDPSFHDYPGHGAHGAH